MELAVHYGRSLPKHRYLELRLESLDRNGLDAILSFGGLSPDPDVFDAFERHYALPSPTVMRRSIDDPQFQEIQRWILPTLQWLELDRL